jgi:WD40 repeat protein/uncharacterized caspase-like protein
MTHFNAPLLLAFAALLSCNPKHATGIETPAFESAETRGAAGDSTTRMSPQEAVRDVYGTSYAVVIGIDHYDHMPDLTGAVRDAKAMSTMLTARGFEVIEVLDKKATKERLRDLPYELQEKLNPEDRLFFYFAGHGVTQESKGYLMPKDAKSWRQGISMSSLQRQLEDTQVRQIFYAADACYSGLGLPNADAFRAGEEDSMPAHWADLAETPRYVSLSAGSVNQKAYDRWEGELGGPHGLFTYFLLEGLDGAADNDQDGWITDVELSAHIDSRVPAGARQVNHEQNPQRAQSGEGRILFANPRIAEILEQKGRVEQVAHLESKLSASERMATVLKLQQKAKKLEEEGLTPQAAALWRAALSLDQGEDLTGGFGESSLPGLHGVEAFGSVLKGHKHIINTLAFSPDGKRLVTGSYDTTAIVWNMETLKPIKTFKGHKSWINTLAFSPDGTRLVTGSWDSTAIVWNMETLEKIKTLKGHEDSIWTLAFSPNGSRLVTGSGDNTAIVWNMETFEKIKTLEGHESRITTLAFSPDGSRLVTGSDDAIVWNMETFEKIKTLEGHEKGINSLAFSPDGTRLVTGSGDKTAIVWNMETLKPIKTLKGHEDTIWALAFSPDGTRLVTGSSDSTAIVWNMETFEPIKTLYKHEGGIFTLAFSPDGSRLVTGSDDETAIVWNMETFEPIKTLEGHEGAILTVAFSPDGTKLATGSDDNTAIVWNMETFENIKTLEGHLDVILTVAFSPDGTKLVTGSWDKTAIVWNMEFLNLPVPELLTETGALTNLRVCRDSLSFKVVPIAPMPAPETVWVDESIPEAEALAACAD